MGYLIWLFIFIIVYKFSVNTYRFIRCKCLRKKYIEWQVDQNNDCPRTKSEVKDLFKRAGIMDATLAVAEPIGFNHLSTYQAKILDNYPIIDSRCVDFTLRSFEEALGFYKNRIFETFNPLYWIDTIIFLPKHILDYIGINTEKVSSKILNVLLSFIWWVLVVSATIYKDNIISFLNDFINSFS